MWIINIEYKMNKGNIVNGVLLMHNSSLKQYILSKMYGFKHYSLKCFEKRSENFSNILLENWISSQYISMISLFYDIVPNKKLIRSRSLVNIFFLDIIASYRGWRHAKGLPVRGQRTWTNAWNTYRTNLILREHKVFLAKNLYGNIPVNELNVAYLAEQVNLLWKLQWEHEWREAKKKRLLTLKKDSSLFKVDLYSMSRGLVSGFTKSGEKAKKQKQVVKKNYFSLGFDPGFTKALLKDSFLKSKKNNLRSRVSIVTDSGEARNKKKNLKKKGVSSSKQKLKKDSWK